MVVSTCHASPVSCARLHDFSGDRHVLKYRDFCWVTAKCIDIGRNDSTTCDRQTLVNTQTAGTSEHRHKQVEAHLQIQPQALLLHSRLALQLLQRLLGQAWVSFVCSPTAADTASHKRCEAMRCRLPNAKVTIADTLTSSHNCICGTLLQDAKSGYIAIALYPRPTHLPQECLLMTRVATAKPVSEIVVTSHPLQPQLKETDTYLLHPGLHSH